MAVSFLKRGKAAQEAMAQADKEAEVRAKQRGARRFWVPNDGESVITFLDGDLNEDGLLVPVTYWEHRLNLNGSWRNYFPCTGGQDPCPLCEQDSPKSLVSLFTVLDHTRWKDRTGKTHSNERKLFVAKRDTIKRLQKMATKRGGLTGWRVSIGRVGERAPEVGTDFDFIEHQDLDELAVELKLKPADIQPFNYDEVIPYYTADELRDMGFGTHVMGQHDTKKLRKASKKVVDDDEDDESDFEEDDAPPPPKKTALAKAKVKVAAEPDFEDDSEDEDDSPLPSKKKPVKAAPTKKVVKKPVALDDDEDSDDSASSDDDGM